MLKFPHIAEAIFENLDVKSLFTSRLVCRVWPQLIDRKKFTWRKKIHYFAYKMPDEYKEAFSDIIRLSSLEELKLLARVFKTYSKGELDLWPHRLLLNRDCEPFKTFFPHFTRWPFLDQGLNYLHWAALRGLTNLIGFILLNTNITVNDTYASGWTAAHNAALYGHVEALKILCPLMDDRNPGNSEGETPLHLPVNEARLDVVKYFMDTLSDRNPGDREGRTPLHLAAMDGHLDVFKLIASYLKDSDLNPKDGSGKTPLHEACEDGNMDIVTYLVPRLKDKNSPCNEGTTPLIQAVKRGHWDIVI